MQKGSIPAAAPQSVRVSVKGGGVTPQARCVEVTRRGSSKIGVIHLTWLVTRLEVNECRVT